MLENIRLSFKGIWSHKMRSFLTMLGIIIGIAAIIAIVPTIEGTNQQIKQNLIGAGSNVVNVNLYQSGYELDPSYQQIPSQIPVISEDLRQQIEDLDGAEEVTLYRKRTTYDEIFHGSDSISGGMLLGIDSHYLKVEGYQIVSGRGFDDNDRQNFRKVCLLDNNAARTLFRSDDPIGQTIEIKGEPFTIIGLVRKSNDFKPDIETVQDYYTYQGQGQSGQVMIHDACWPILYRFDEPQCVSVKAVNTDAMTKVGKSTADLLNSSLGFPLSDASAGAGGVVSTDMAAVDTIGGADAEVVDSGDQSQSQGIQYQNEDLLEQAKQLQEMSNATNRMLIWIASISLLVGGIGVMNIMLVSVTERTREIGLKKAIGARKGRILGQFLTEAAVLTSLGGLFGVVIGMILAKVISTVNGTLYAISIPAIIVSVVFSMVIGIVFGLLPSIKAANLNPIDALRYE